MNHIQLPLLCLLALSSYAANPIEGTWRVNYTRMRIDPLPVVTYEKDAAGLRASSTDNSQPTVINFDGQDHPARRQSALYDGNTYHRINKRAFETVSKKQGKTITTTVRTISSDGRHMTATIDGAYPNGNSFHNVNVYDRVSKEDPSDLFIGKWRLDPAKLQVAKPITYTFHADGGDGLTMKTSTGYGFTAKFDGNEYPAQSTGAQASIRLRRIDNRTFEMDAFAYGKQINSQRIELSPDGKEITMTTKPSSNPSIIVNVLEKQP